jgi:hypothetical protein
MAIINSYPYDIIIHDKDAWIGTDSLNRQTKQYTAEAVANYLNVKGKVSIGGQMIYKFVQIPFNGLGTFAFATGGGDGTAFSAITSVKISNRQLNGQNTVAWLDYLVSDQILISAQDQISEFGHYRITSYTVDPVNGDYYTLNLDYIGGNGSIYIDKFYDIVDFNISSGDLHYTHSQNVASATWSVAHNLGKFPSVTVALSTGQQGFGDVTFIDTNNLTITFAGAETGKAYMN